MWISTHVLVFAVVILTRPTFSEDLDEENETFQLEGFGDFGFGRRIAAEDVQPTEQQLQQQQSQQQQQQYGHRRRNGQLRHRRRRRKNDAAVANRHPRRQGRFLNAPLDMLSERLASTSSLLFRLIGESAGGSAGGGATPAENEVTARDGRDDDGYPDISESDANAVDDFAGDEVTDALDEKIEGFDGDVPGAVDFNDDDVKGRDETRSSALTDDIASSELPVEHRGGGGGEDGGIVLDEDVATGSGDFTAEVNRVQEWRPSKRRQNVGTAATKSRKGDSATALASQAPKKRRFRPFRRRKNMARRDRTAATDDEKDETPDAVEEKEDNPSSPLKITDEATFAEPSFKRERVPIHRSRVRTTTTTTAPLQRVMDEVGDGIRAGAAPPPPLEPADLASMSLHELQEVMRMRAELVKAPRKPATATAKPALQELSADFDEVQRETEEASPVGSREEEVDFNEPLEIDFDNEFPMLGDFTSDDDDDTASTAFPNFPDLHEKDSPSRTNTYFTFPTTVIVTSTTTTTTSTTTPFPTTYRVRTTTTASTTTRLPTPTTTGPTAFYFTTRPSERPRQKHFWRRRPKATTLRTTTSPSPLPREDVLDFSYVTDEASLLSDMMDMTTFGLKNGVKAPEKKSRPALPLPPLPPRKGDGINRQTFSETPGSTYFVPPPEKEAPVKTQSEPREKAELPAFPNFPTEETPIYYEDVTAAKSSPDANQDELSDLFSDDRPVPASVHNFNDDSIHDGEEVVNFRDDVPQTFGDGGNSNVNNAFTVRPTSISSGSKSTGTFMSFSIGSPTAETAFDSSGDVLQLGGAHATPPQTPQTQPLDFYDAFQAPPPDVMEDDDDLAPERVPPKYVPPPGGNVVHAEKYDDPFSNYFHHPNHRYPEESNFSPPPPPPPPTNAPPTTPDRPKPFTVRMHKRPADHAERKETYPTPSTPPPTAFTARPTRPATSQVVPLKSDPFSSKFNTVAPFTVRPSPRTRNPAFQTRTNGINRQDVAGHRDQQQRRQQQQQQNHFQKQEQRFQQQSRFQQKQHQQHQQQLQQQPHFKTKLKQQHFHQKQQHNKHFQQQQKQQKKQLLQKHQQNTHNQKQYQQQQPQLTLKTTFPKSPKTQSPERANERQPPPPPPRPHVAIPHPATKKPFVVRVSTPSPTPHAVQGGRPTPFTVRPVRRNFRPYQSSSPSGGAPPKQRVPTLSVPQAPHPNQNQPSPSASRYRPPPPPATATTRRTTPKAPTRPFTVRPGTQNSHASQKPFTVSPKKRLVQFNYVQPSKLDPSQKISLKPFTVPSKKTLAPFNYVNPSNIKPSPFAKDEEEEAWPEEEVWDEEEGDRSGMFSPSVFSKHDVQLKEPFGNAPTFFQTRPTSVGEVHPTRPNIMNHRRPAGAPAQPKTPSLDMDYLEALYGDDDEEEEEAAVPEGNYQWEVSNMFSQVGQDGKNYGAFGNTFTLQDHGKGNTDAKTKQEGAQKDEGEEKTPEAGKGEKKVIKGYLKNPFGSDFIKLEVDSDRLKHNKTSGVIHVPLVVVNKNAGVMRAAGPHRKRPGKRRRKKHNRRRPGFILPKSPIGPKPPQKKLGPNQKVSKAQQTLKATVSKKPLPNAKDGKQQQMKQQHVKMQQAKQQLVKQQQNAPPRKKHGPSLRPKKTAAVRRRPGRPRQRPPPPHKQPQLRLPLPHASAPHMAQGIQAINRLPGLMHKFIAGMGIDSSSFSGRDLKGD